MKAHTKQLYETARRGLAQGDAGYWRAAKAMAELADEGETQREIAAELSTPSKAFSPTSVGYYLRIWSDYHGNQTKLTFGEAMSLVRGPRSNSENLPRTPERRAALAADLLKDKAVYDTPAVQKVVDRQVDRRLRQAAAVSNRAAGIPTRTEATRSGRRLSVVVNRMFWRDLLWAIEKATSLLNDAAGEVGRTGMPEGQSGEILRATRALSKAAERFSATAAKRAIGSPMERGA